jgi:hypothetical protein
MMDIVEQLDEHLRFNGKDQLSRDAKNYIERLREALNADNQTIRLHLGEMTQQEMRTIKAAFAWVISRAEMKEDK